MSEPGQRNTKSDPDRPAWLEIVRQHVASLRFGVVQIVVHDSEVTQIERTERVRFEKPRPDSSQKP